VDSHVFTRELERFARICRVVQELPHTNLGQVGPRLAAFNTVRAREKFLQVAGITVVPADLSEIILAAQGLKDGEQAVKDKLMEIHNYGTALASTAQENVLRKAKLCVALNRWIEANENDDCAARCWSSIPTNYG